MIPTKFFYDLEFHEDGRTIDFLSIGIVKETGEEYYAVNAGMNVDAVKAHPFLRDHVWPLLPLIDPDGKVQLSTRPEDTRGCLLNLEHPDVRPQVQIAREVHDFLVPIGGRWIPAREYPCELWAWYAAYDHVALAQLFGRMIDLPPGIPMWTNDLRQEAHRLGLDGDDMPRQKDGQHNALADARHNKVMHDYLVWVREHQARVARHEAKSMPIDEPDLTEEWAEAARIEMNVVLPPSLAPADKRRIGMGHFVAVDHFVDGLIPISHDLSVAHRMVRDKVREVVEEHRRQS